MRLRLLIKVACALVLLGGTMVTNAQENRVGAVTFTLADAYYHFDAKRHMNNAAMPNVSLAYNFSEQWAGEATVGVVNTTNHSDINTHGVLYLVDGIYRFKPHWYFQPYLSGGVGVLGLKPVAASNSQYQSNINLGLGTQLFADRFVALRAEVKDLYTLSGGKQDFLFNFGISFLIGG